MKPVVQIWIQESALAQIERGNFPSSIWTRDPGKENVICINVTYDWFRSMREYELKLKQNDLPF